MAETVLAVDHVTKTFRMHHERPTSLKERITRRSRARYEDFVALRDVTFDVREGEVFGVIGQNGSGKSTLLKCMAGILQPNSGSVRVSRRMSALLELGAGFHPELTGRDNVFLNASILGMTRRDIAARFDDIVEFAGLGTFIDSPVKTYSSGMYVRLAFAVAINVDPHLLIIDEILAVGDVSFQQRCLEKFVQFRDEGRTIVLVTHAMNTVKEMCDRAVWLTHGTLTGEGSPSELVDSYTQAMLGPTPAHLEGSVRRGSGELQVRRVELVGSGDAAAGRVHTGDNVRLRLHLQCHQPVQRPVIGLAIETSGGVLVTAPTTRDVGLVPESIAADTTVDLELPALALLPGSYLVHTTVSDFSRAHEYDYLHRAMRLDVATGSSQESSGVVTLQPHWSIRRAGSAPLEPGSGS
jgi:ABC-type polysaccharide/polyol phosphate transport system ATPase subunit